MFHPISIPYGCVMLFNVVNLKEGFTIEDVELTLGEMCNVVKNTYGDDNGGFIGGQVYKYSGFVSNEGSFDSKKMTQDHLVIMTFWKSFEQHEKSHADEVFRKTFTALTNMCSETKELGYDMLWQGEAKTQ